MKNSLDFIYCRHSVRKFKNDPVLEVDLNAILEAATQAPSGKNMQNWHFVVIQDKSKIEQIGHLVDKKNATLSECLKDEQKRKMFRASVKYHTVFVGAPVLILVYAGPYGTMAGDLIADGLMSQNEVEEIFQANPKIQNIAAAMQNILLAAASLGYGTCWMTGPTYAGREISQYLGFHKPNYFLAAMTPLGIPMVPVVSGPPRKALHEVVTFI